MHVRFFVITLLMGILGTYLLFLPVVPVLENSDFKTKRTLLLVYMPSGEEFCISFVHSINRRPVYDFLRREGDYLVIVRSRYDSFGAGMPETSNQEGTLRVAEDGWLEWIVNRPVPEVTIRVGRVAEHTLHIRGKNIPLAQLAEPGSGLTMRSRLIRILDFLKGRHIP